ncbi:MAG: hypothetical protein PVI75_01985 [Gammaproteobacteria bacterium]|jgi:hypothetical protein
MEKLIGLWGYSRSLSTAFERMMIERGDFEIFHEPFAYYYSKKHKGQQQFNLSPPRIIEQLDNPASYNQIKNLLINSSKSKNTFFKELSFFVSNEFIQDTDFIKKITNTFIIRDLKKTIISLAKLSKKLNFNSLCIGIREQYQIFRAVQEKTGTIPVVIDADDLVNNPEKIIRAYCKAVDIPYLSTALQWKPCFDSRWEIFKIAFQEVGESSGFKKTESTSFDMLYNSQTLLELYENNKHYYKFLSQYRLT